ncbi:hypothetical protein GTP58_04705 [Duganella sp. CY15W]|nr:hypothetical protein [Duganella sp. CY15W]
MNRTSIIFSVLLMTSAPAYAQQQAAALDLSAPARPVLTDDIIRKAVRETIAEDPHPAPAPAQNALVLRGSSAQTRMAAAFEQAKIPSCLHEDALKQQPAMIGPVNVVGPYSLPWIIAAAVRGKCL